LLLLVSRAGEVVTREDIREALWGSDTFVDFEQGVNSAIKQVREALGEDADRPLYLETVP
jgi:DNA-binding winged helix-turn-helix (wHTH) protein